MKKFLAFFTGLAGYIHIVLFPIFISLVLSLIAYLTMPGMLGLLLSMFFCACGLVTGLIMALVVLKRRGPAAFVPSADAGPESTDNLEEEHTDPS